MVNQEEARNALVFSNLDQSCNKNAINENFINSCNEENIESLRLLNSLYGSCITKDTISYCSTIAIRADKVDVLKFIFEVFSGITKKEKEEYLSISVNSNSQNCFNYLYKEKNITSYELMEYASNYKNFLIMEIMWAKQQLDSNPDDAKALYILALNEFHNGGNPDPLYERAALQGHAGACFKLAQDCISNENPEHNDPEQARKYINLGLTENTNHTNFDTNYYKQAEFRKELEGLLKTVPVLEKMKKLTM